MTTTPKRTTTISRRIGRSIRASSVRSVLGSYVNLTIASCVLALVIIAFTRGQLGYRPEASEAPRVR
jgi:hypothetical protein